MNEKTCGNCTHWGKPIGMTKFRRCTAIGDNEDRPQSTDLAIVNGDYGHGGTLQTQADFGCIFFFPRDVTPTP